VESSCKSVILSFYRKRQSDIATYYSMDSYLVYCNNIQELMEELQLEHDYGQWRHFSDSSKVGLKAVLLHNGNEFPSVPLVHAVHMTEMYDNLQVCCRKYAMKNTSRNMY
jgi:hypothetical protein